MVEPRPFPDGGELASRLRALVVVLRPSFLRRLGFGGEGIDDLTEDGGLAWRSALLQLGSEAGASADLVAWVAETVAVEERNAQDGLVLLGQLVADLAHLGALSPDQDRAWAANVIAVRHHLRRYGLSVGGGALRLLADNQAEWARRAPLTRRALDALTHLQRVDLDRGAEPEARHDDLVVDVEFLRPLFG